MSRERDAINALAEALRAGPVGRPIVIFRWQTVAGFEIELLSGARRLDLGPEVHPRERLEDALTDAFCALAAT